MPKLWIFHQKLVQNVDVKDLRHTTCKLESGNLPTTRPVKVALAQLHFQIAQTDRSDQDRSIVLDMDGNAIFEMRTTHDETLHNYITTPVNPKDYHYFFLGMKRELPVPPLQQTSTQKSLMLHHFS